jgi:hypothetical protein
MTLVDLLRAAEDSLSLEGKASADQVAALRQTFEGLPPETIQTGLKAIWPDVEIVDGKVRRLTANHAAAILMTAGTTQPETFRAAWADIAP